MEENTSMDLSAFSFGTLWKEATKAVDSIATSIVNGTKHFNETMVATQAGTHDWSVKVLSSSQSKNLPTIIILGVIIVLILIAAIAIKAKK